MTTTPPEDTETPKTAEERLHDALIGFTGCIGEALEDVCSYGLTIGEGYVPFDPDPEDECEEDEAACSQAWVRVMGVTPFGGVDSFGGDSCSVALRLELEVGVLRCIEIAEDGEAPSASDVLVAAMQSMTDMLALQCAALECDVWESVDLGTWSPSGPLGGQYGGTWTFTVEL